MRKCHVSGLHKPGGPGLGHTPLHPAPQVSLCSVDRGPVRVMVSGPPPLPAHILPRDLCECSGVTPWLKTMKAHHPGSGLVTQMCDAFSCLQAFVHASAFPPRLSEACSPSIPFSFHAGSLPNHSDGLGRHSRRDVPLNPVTESCTASKRNISACRPRRVSMPLPHPSCRTQYFVKQT